MRWVLQLLVLLRVDDGLVSTLWCKVLVDHHEVAAEFRKFSKLAIWDRYTVKTRVVVDACYCGFVVAADAGCCGRWLLGTLAAVNCWSLRIAGRSERWSWLIAGLFNTLMAVRRARSPLLLRFHASTRPRC